MNLSELPKEVTVNTLRLKNEETGNIFVGVTDKTLEFYGGFSFNDLKRFEVLEIFDYDPR